MAIIKKTITGLKPDTNYIFSLKPKNVEISAADTLSETLRISIPAYSVSPSPIQNAGMKSFFETVMIYFDPINDLDLDSYEYEIYDNALGTGVPVASGKNKANVFTVAVPNTTDSQQKQYWARVRTVNTSGGVSNYTNLFTDFATPQIGSQYIASLTAAKITAGTIGAHTITLAGATSIIKSSTYSSTQGWQIDGAGNATFNTATIRGELSSGTSPNWFRVDASGNIWSGADTFTNAATKFRVSNAGVLTAASGTVGGVSMASNKLYIGTGTYGNANTSFYVDNTGQFSLKDKLTWNGTTLNINGVINSTSGTIGGFTLGATTLSASTSTTVNFETTSTSVTISSNSSIISRYEFDGFFADFYEEVRINNYAAGGSGAINVTGTASGSQSTRWYTSYGEFNPSDIRLKEVIDKNVDALSAINKVETFKFKFKNDDKNVEHFGFSAQQIYQHIPNVAHPGGEDPNVKPWGLTQGILIPYLVKSIQQLSEKIDELESRLL